MEELRLEPTGSSEDSFTLLVKARARLMRTADAAVLCDLPFEFRSEPALFYDWTLKEALQNVANTAYRELAEQMVAQLFLTRSEGPSLLGAGYRREPLESTARTILASNRKPLLAASRIQLASSSAAGQGALGVFSTADSPFFSLQKPLTKDQAVDGAVHDVEASLHGLNDHPNLIVQLMAMTTAIPMSLYGQTKGVVRGLSNKRFRSADARLTTAAQPARPPQQIAKQVAKTLSLETSQTVVLVEEPLPWGDEHDLASIQRALQSARTGVLHPQLVEDKPPQQGCLETDLALEIHLVSAALEGKEGINPPLAVCVELKAQLVRLIDGQELYTCVLQYRSREHSFTQWAAKDARLFHKELEQCYQLLSRTVVNNLTSDSSLQWIR